MRELSGSERTRNGLVLRRSCVVVGRSRDVGRFGLIDEWHLDFVNALEYAEFDLSPRPRQSVVPPGREAVKKDIQSF